MRFYTIVAITLVPFLMGNKGGCTEDNTPTTAQIELNLPPALRDCPYAPPSPGKGASANQRAVYIAKLYAAWEDCHGDVKDIDRLYKKWKSEVKNLSRPS